MQFLIFGGLIVLVVVFLVLLSGIRIIPNTRIGIVEKRFSFNGSVKSGFIALNGEAGFEPRVLRGGVHYLMPIQYGVRMASLVTIPQGKIGYILASDGKLLDSTQTLASNAEVSDFQDVESFLKSGGQRGPQRRILREGTYAINLMQFIVLTDERIYSLPLSRDEMQTIQGMAQVIAERGGFVPVIIKDTDDKIGIATVHDGPSLGQGEIIAPVVGDDPKNPETYHNKFQDPDKFLKAGGFRGRQLQVLVEGTYYVNRLFATVEMIQKTIIEVGNVGVVVSYTGEAGEDLSGSDYRHGELVARGKRGVWEETLMPGKYAFNTYAGKVVAVATPHFLLKKGCHHICAQQFDEKLNQDSLITKDSVGPLLPLSPVVPSYYQEGPLVLK